MGWLAYALVSVGAAALTAILAKVGVEGVPSNLATAIRTIVITGFAWAIVTATGEHHALANISRRSLWFLVLSAVATGVSQPPADRFTQKYGFRPLGHLTARLQVYAAQALADPANFFDGGEFRRRVSEEPSPSP